MTVLLSLAFMLGQMEDRGGQARAAYNTSLKRKLELSAAFLRATFGNLRPPFLRTLLIGFEPFGLPADRAGSLPPTRLTALARMPPRARVG